MEEIEIQNITPMEKVESVEAENLYYKYKRRYCVFFFVPLAIFVIFLVLIIAQAFNSSLNAMLLLFAGLLTLIGFVVYLDKMRPYRELLKIAHHNDMIRHDEKIRARERKRLMTENKTSYTSQQIHETAEEYEHLDGQKGQ